MKLSLSSQLIQFLSSFLIGLPLGLLYDILRVVYHRIGRRFLSGLLDFLFVLVCFVTVCWFAMTMADGQLRMYNLASTGLGGLMYALLFSKYVRRAGRFIIDVFLYFVHVVVWPVWGTFALGKNFYKKTKKLFLYEQKSVRMKNDIRRVRLFSQNRSHLRRKGHDFDASKEKSGVLSKGRRSRFGRLRRGDTGEAANRTQHAGQPQHGSDATEGRAVVEERRSVIVFRI
jgi:spore cortex biosynthesis protein YabQ